MARSGSGEQRTDQSPRNATQRANAKRNASAPKAVDEERSIEMNREPDRFLGGFGLDLPRAAWSPQLETFRRGDQIVVRADLPGLKRQDVKVEVDNGMLTISGERCEEHDENRDDFYRSERRYGRFYRSLSLPEGVTGERCEATFKDGVLEVTLPAPKATARNAKRIPVR